MPGLKLTKLVKGATVWHAHKVIGLKCWQTVSESAEYKHNNNWVYTLRCVNLSAHNKSFRDSIRSFVTPWIPMKHICNWSCVMLPAMATGDTSYPICFTRYSRCLSTTSELTAACSELTHWGRRMHIAVVVVVVVIVLVLVVVVVVFNWHIRVWVSWLTSHMQGKNKFIIIQTYMRQYTKPSLVQIMVCCLFCANPLTEPMMTYCLLNHKNYISVTFCLKFKSFHSRKFIWKYRLRNGGHFFSASMC